MARVVVTGGAGFIGSHLCEALLARGDEVVCVDNLSSSDGANIVGLKSSPRFSFHGHDVAQGLAVEGAVEVVLHLASPASPPEYLRLGIETLAVGSRGTEACLQLAERCGARFVLASTSEVYGEPAAHPQPEEYWGNVNPIGPRSVYDEAKRFAEALSMAYLRARGVDVGIVRIFNTYGPRLRTGDGRVVSNFIHQALLGVPLTIYGDGSQTRSFCYIDDLVAGLLAMVDHPGVTGPVNLGRPDETTIAELAERVRVLTGSASEIVYRPVPTDDPTRRCPVISRASELLGWTPHVSLEAGLTTTIAWFEEALHA